MQSFVEAALGHLLPQSIQVDQVAVQAIRQLTQVFETECGKECPPTLVIRSSRPELMIQPELPLVGEVLFEVRPVFIGLERRADSGFDRIQPQQMGGKTMQCADLRLFNITKRGFGTGYDFVGGPTVPRTQVRDGHRSAAGRRIVATFESHQRSQPLAQPEFHFRGRFIGERQRHDAREVQRVRPAHQKVQEPVDEQRGLAGSRSGDHDDVTVECRRRGFPRRLIRYLHLFSHAPPSASAPRVRFWLAKIGTPATSWADGHGGTPSKTHNGCNRRQAQ